MDGPVPSKLQLLAVPLVLAVLLFAVSAAHATPVGPNAVPPALEEEGEEFDEFEEGEEAEAESECEEAEEEFEEGGLSRAELKEYCGEAAGRNGKNASGSVAPEECILRSAHAHATESHDSLKVTVGYTASEPASATIEVRSGPSRLASVHHHLGRSGVLRIAKDLGRKQIDRVVVRFKIPTCPQFQTKSVKVG